MKKIELSTELLGMPYGTYHGIFNTDYFFDSSQIDEDFKDGYIEYDSNYAWGNFDNNAYMKAIVNVIDDYLTNDFDLSDYFEAQFTCVGFDSPRYYNFRDDHFHINMEIDDINYQKLYEIAIDHKEDFSAFLKDNYSSYDGFMSYTADNWDEWISGMNKDRVQEIAAIICFIVSISDIDYAYVLDRSELYYSEFIDESEIEDFKDHVQKTAFLDDDDYSIWQLAIIEKYYPFGNDIQKLYLSHSIEEIISIISDKHDGLGYEIIKAKVTQVFRSIESHTLELQL